MKRFCEAECRAWPILLATNGGDPAAKWRARYSSALSLWPGSPAHARCKRLERRAPLSPGLASYWPGFRPALARIWLPRPVMSCNYAPHHAFGESALMACGGGVWRGTDTCQAKAGDEIIDNRARSAGCAIGVQR